MTNNCKTLLILCVFSMACMGRGMTVRDAKMADVSKIQGKQIEKVYFVPFDLGAVQLKGDHGATNIAEENKQKWFTHVMVGAAAEFMNNHSGIKAVLVRNAETPYDKQIFAKTKVNVEVAGKVPPDAIVVSGKYLFSENISGTSRAFLGVMSGKSWNRADVAIRRGKSDIYSSKFDGKYMGGGFSWGYETLGVNEGLGMGIVQTIEKLRKGEPISSK